ncbi:MAG: hypothetical protein CL663_03665 [Bacteroidetes bacterium]|nr:hypothetical protein [Bacteroidota bacterium]
MKKTLTLKGLILIVVVLFSSELFAQLSLTGEFRPRTEYRHGYKTLSATDADAAFFTSQRTRFNVHFKGENFKVGLSLQDVRTWGSVKQLNISDEYLAVHEAWAQYFFTDGISIKVGRQELVYDDHRIFGNVGWTQQARSHDVAIFKFRDANFKLDAGFAYNQDKENLFGTVYNLKNYKAFQYLWAHTNFGKVAASFLVLNNGIQYQAIGDPAYPTAYSQTYGTRLTYDEKGFSFAGAFYGQGGKNGSNKDLSAYYYALEAGLELNHEFKVVVGYEFLSGNDQQDVGGMADKSFTPLYGTNHKFNGFMDYFYVGNNVGGLGLKDFYTTIKFKKDKFSANGTVHLFSTVGSLESVNLEKSLGTEFDFTFAYKFNKYVTLSAGYSQMFGKDALEFVKGGDSSETNNWIWMMFTFKPKFM